MSEILIGGGSTPPPVFTRLADVPRTASDRVMVGVGGYLYLIAGVTGSNRTKISAIDRYDISNDSWVSGWSSNVQATGRPYAFSDEVNGLIYIGGGQSINPKALSSINTSTHARKNYPNSPFNTYGSVCAVVGGEVYVFGGGYSSYSFAKFDLANEMWSSLPARTGMMGYPTGCEYKGLVYVFSNGAANIYNPVNQIWEVGEPSGYNVSEGCCGVLGDYAYLFGVGTSGAIVRYGFLNDSWELLTAVSEPKPFATYGGGCTVYNGELYYFPGNTNQLWKMTP